MAGEVAPRESGDEQLPARELRASHEDRDRVVELLRMAAGDGRLSADELDQRLEVALTARTYGELAALTRDLPAAPGLTTAAEPKDLIRIESRSGSARRDGRWVVPRRMEIRVSSGSVRLDFTEAVITQATLRDRRRGEQRVADPDHQARHRGRHRRRLGRQRFRPGPAARGPGTPALLSIQVSGKVGSGSVMARPPRLPRRTFWQWLLRRPKPRPALPSR